MVSIDINPNAFWIEHGILKSVVGGTGAYGERHCRGKARRGRARELIQSCNGAVAH